MSSPAPTMPPTSRASSRPLTEGPRWYRSKIRAWGPLVALIVPGIVGLIAYASLRYSDTALSGAVGLVGGVVAAPGLLLVGAPFGDREIYPWAVIGSALLWMVVGYWAARRATRNPMATWSDFWAQYVWMLIGIWAGSLAALGIASYVIGDALL